MIPRLSILFALALAWSPAPGHAQSAVATADRWTRAAITFVHNLDAGAYEDAAANVADAVPADALSAAQLEAIWSQVEGQAGEFVDMRGYAVTQRDSLRIVDLDARFERATLRIRVVLTPHEKLSGLWFLPADPPPYNPPAYADTAAFHEVEVTVGSAPWELPGTFAIPDGDGAVPAVVLVHGSGPHDRDETIGPNRPFRDLAWGLASRGIAVLRYD